MAASLIKSGTYKDGFNSSNYKEILIDSADDLENLEIPCDVGSVAYSADLSMAYIMDGSGNWVRAL